MDASVDVILFRHGIAEDAGAAAQRGVADADRALTARGRTRTRQAAAGLVALVKAPARVVHSPLLRARETAEIVARAWHTRTNESASLRPGTAAEEFLDWLVAHAEGTPVVAVGHEPFLSDWVARAVGAGTAAEFVMKKAGACRLCFERPRFGTATVHWLVPPRLLRCLGRR